MLVAAGPNFGHLGRTDCGGGVDMPACKATASASLSVSVSLHKEKKNKT